MQTLLSQNQAANFNSDWSLDTVAKNTTEIIKTILTGAAKLPNISTRRSCTIKQSDLVFN